MKSFVPALAAVLESGNIVFKPTNKNRTAWLLVNGTYGSYLHGVNSVNTLLTATSALRTHLITALYSAVHTPVAYLYVHGPRWLGFWEGLDLPDICAGLTMVPAKEWAGGRAEVLCAALVERRAHATLLGIAVLSGLMGIHAGVNACTLRWALRKP